MGTQATPNGKTANLLIGEQTVFDTAAPAPYIRTPFYSENMGEQKGLESDELLGSVRHNDRDQEKPAPGLVAHSGQLAVPICVNHLPYWLKGAFGAPVTTGAGPYTHVFASGNTVLPYRTIEIEKRRAAAFFQHVGCLVSSIAFDFSREAGFRRASIELAGRNEEKLSASAGGVPAAALPLAQLPSAAGILRIGGVTAANFLGGSLDYQNNPEPDESLNGTDYVSGYFLDQPATCGGTIRARYVDETYYDLMKAGNPVDIELEFRLNAAQMMTFSLPNVRFQRGPFAPISGPGGLEAEMSYRAEQSESQPMLTVSVINSVAGY